MKYFKKYHKEKIGELRNIVIKANSENSENKNNGFYNWLIKKTNYITDYDLLLKINDIFDLNRSQFNIKNLENIKIVNGYIQKNEIYNILKNDGFIFPFTQSTM